MDETEIARLRDRLGRADNAMRNIRRLCDEAEVLNVKELPTPRDNMTVTRSWSSINPDEVRWLLDQAERP